eukprot:SAG25_NODE_133_length_14402_cov_15.122142_15_plen_254_part_00
MQQLTEELVSALALAQTSLDERDNATARLAEQRAENVAMRQRVSELEEKMAAAAVAAAAAGSSSSSDQARRDDAQEGIESGDAAWLAELGSIVALEKLLVEKEAENINLRRRLGRAEESETEGGSPPTLAAAGNGDIPSPAVPSSSAAPPSSGAHAEVHTPLEAPPGPITLYYEHSDRTSPAAVRTTARLVESVDELRQLCAAGTVASSTRVWKPGLQRWQPFCQMLWPSTRVFPVKGDRLSSSTTSALGGES